MAKIRSLTQSSRVASRSISKPIVFEFKRMLIFATAKELPASFNVLSENLSDKDKTAGKGLKTIRAVDRCWRPQPFDFDLNDIVPMFNTTGATY